MKRTIIIGNGFDLDAGLHTGYKNFAASDCWPFKDEQKMNEIEPLAYTLNVQAQLNTWFDVEEVLFQYAQKKTGYYTNDRLLPYDKQSFQRLLFSLENYLLREQANFTPNKGSVAESLMKVLTMKKMSDNTIYSFNYTDLNAIANKMGISKRIKFESIHGSLSKHDMILGVGDRHELRSDYYFLYKTMSPHFSSHHIIPDMQESDEVIFFGHSLGFNDYAYFQPFFNSQVRYGNYDPSKRKKIVIFTYNQDSAFEIKRNLRDLTGNDVNLLYSLNDFKIVCTDGTMPNEVAEIRNWMMYR